MKHLPALEDGPWKPVCGKELNGLKKLKRKGKEPARRANGAQTFRLDLDAPEPAGAAAAAAAAPGLRDRPPRLQPAPAPGPARGVPAVPPAGGAAAAGERGGARAPDPLDTRKRGFALGEAAAGLPTPPPPPQDQAPGAPEAQAFREPGLRPRILLCAPPAPAARPGESAYPSISHVIYSHPPDAAASPRKRPGEAPAGSPEIKALQQTRRLLANARERTRVHTISAAFEALRKQVPCYSYGQKLSKLAILRIACNYILSLARLADLDYSADRSNLSFSECVQRCTRTLQAEGRAKKRKEWVKNKRVKMTTGSKRPTLGFFVRDFSASDASLPFQTPVGQTEAAALGGVTCQPLPLSHRFFAPDLRGGTHFKGGETEAERCCAGPAGPGAWSKPPCESRAAF
ncbi:transcription factor ATOH8 isoform X3 [Dasypus novemcinctus]|uniref:transcription factor ATOH8 isoform X3 n=1 Tax=Dasypus novemcinctus TaxID=9361 RepID=UPI00265FD335|nr:transcription factor ATOH8 isoform X2 [Dasypus novemcinctus]